MNKGRLTVCFSGLLLRLGLLTSLAAGACTKHPEPSTISPDVIQDCAEGQGIAAIRSIWDELGVVTRPSDLWGEDAVLHVERLDFLFTNDAHRYVVLALTNQEGPQARMHWQCLLFSQGDTEWEFLGYVDVTAQKFRSPINPRLVRLGGHTYLVVEQLMGWGTGILVYLDMWYQMTGKSGVQVLHYPVRGYSMGLSRGLAFEYEGRMISYGPRGNSYGVEIQVEGLYSYWDVQEQTGGPLFSVERTREYLWDSSAHCFVEQGALALNGDNDWFVREHFEALRHIAADGTEQKRAWLEGFLSEVTVSPEKETLLGLLND